MPPVRSLAVCVALIALSAAMPAAAAAPTINKRVAKLELQVRALRAQIVKNDQVWQAALTRQDNHETCNIATVYATLAQMYASFGQQIASLQGKTLTPATLPPFDAGDACKVANG